MLVRYFSVFIVSSVSVLVISLFPVCVHAKQRRILFSDACPNITNVKALGGIRYLIYKKYTEVLCSLCLPVTNLSGNTPKKKTCNIGSTCISYANQNDK